MNTHEVRLSVVVVPVGGPEFVRRCLNHLLPQTDERAVEIIVPYDSTREGIGDLQARFSNVVFMSVSRIETKAPPGTQAAFIEIYDRLSAVGLDAAQGAILALLQDTTIPRADWCSQVLEAHDLPHEIIGGAVEHGGSGALEWAVYFLDFGRYRLPLSEGPAQLVTDVNVSYKRAVLEAVRPLWIDGYHETLVNSTLVKQGAVMWQRPQIVVHIDRGRLALRSVLTERVQWGRLLGRLRSQGCSVGRRLAYLVSSPLIPLLLTARVTRRNLAVKQSRLQLIRSLPFLLLLATAWGVGEFLGYLHGGS